MTARILDGKATAAALKSELAARVARLAERGAAPGLGTVLVGEDPGSVAYVAGKHRDCAQVGIASIRVDLPATAAQEDVARAVDRLNADPACTGYIVQLPLPAGVEEAPLLEAIDPAKDADGLHPVNLGRLVLRVGGDVDFPLPCTPAGVLELLDRHGIDLAGTIGLLLSRRGVDATVVNCHTRTRDLPAIVRGADVVIAAVGSPRLVTADWVAEGAVVVDVGVSRTVDPDGRARIVGDVAPDVRDVASWVSPNPGGVGPMTRAMLLANVVRLAERAAGLAERSARPSSVV